MVNIYETYIDSPVGWLELTASEDALQAIRFLEATPNNSSVSSKGVISQVEQQLKEYFNGKRTSFSIPINPGGTEFQQSVWKQLLEIPYGQTINYGELALKMGSRNKMRAVGRANGKNPIPIIIPCHRVIGANNNLVGYAGGIRRKKFLLKHEGALLL